MTSAVDAVVIGAGPNGLVTANLLADAGWSVLVLEAHERPGGAVRTEEVTSPGFRNDLFSAFYPLAAASPVMTGLHLEEHGLRWRRAPLVLAHPTPSGAVAQLSTDLDVTAASLDRFAPGDGDGWRRLHDVWSEVRDPLLGSLLGPFPPVRNGLRLVGRLGRRRLLPFARMALLTVRRLAEEHFEGEGAGLLLAGNALHSDLTPDSTLSGFMGWLLASIGQDHGWPVPEGGADRLIDALVARFVAGGGELRCSTPVVEVIVRDGVATGVRTADGTVIEAGRAVVADVVAPKLYHDLVGDEHLPHRVRADLARYQRAASTFKVDWALDRPVPWRHEGIAGAGTVHLADSLDELTMTSAQIACGQVPDQPFVLLGQMTTSDPSRSPAGTESAWAYTSVPQEIRGDAAGEVKGTWDHDDAERFADRIERRIEAQAPGFRATIRSRSILTPPAMEATDANLLGGDKSLGTVAFHQQLVFRPTIGLARPETPVRRLYLGSGSAHPGGGVHGSCGANAARAALLHARLRR